MRLFVAAASCLFASLVTAEELTLRQVVAAAVERNPAARASEAAVAGARARLGEARASWLPRAELVASTTRSNNPVFVFGSLLEQGRFDGRHFDPLFLNDPDPLRNDRLAVNLRYILFDKLHRLGSTQLARNGLEQAAQVAAEARQRIRADAIRAFYAVAVADERRAVARAAVDAGAAEAAAIRDRFEHDLVVRSDVLAAEVQLAQFRQQEVDAHGESEIARAALATLIQLPSSDRIQISAGQRESAAFVEIGLEEALQRAAVRRAHLVAARLEADNARIVLRTARASRLPRLDAAGSWGASGRTFRDQSSDHAIGLVASVDLFDPGKRSRSAAARAAMDAAGAAENAARDSVTMEVVTAWHRYRAAEQRVDLAERAAEHAHAATQIIRDRYTNGLTTVAEQLRADATAVRARLDVLAARHERVIGYAELLRAMGELHDVDAFP